MGRLWTTSVDTFWLVAIFVMLAWPWAFFGVVWSRGGIQMNSRLANFVMDNPHNTQYFITLISNLLAAVIAHLFSKAILRLSQHRLNQNPTRSLFDISFISGLRNQHNPWGIFGAIRNLFTSGRTIHVILVGVCWSIFLNVASGAASLLAPAPFDTTTSLNGTELDFSSNATDCLAWLSNNSMPPYCGWLTYNGMTYTSCLGENQMVDVLESGRGNILSLVTNNSQTLDFTQLGAKNGLHFLGPIRGVLPIGPNGVPALDTLENSVLLEQTLSSAHSYNYTLELQGLYSNVSCEYAPQSPVNVSAVPGETSGWVIQNNGTCDGQANFLVDEGVYQYIEMNSNNGLTSWACKSLNETELSYSIYLFGRVNYATEIGNITCTMSPVQPATFLVTYESVRGTFSSTGPVEFAAANFTGFLDQSVIALGQLIADAQDMDDNQVAESVITLGVKSFGLPSNQQNPQYLRLYEAMIQGIIEYLATYNRLLYSTLDRPPSCTRTVSGTVTYAVFGWSVTPAHIGFLMATTLINLASLFIMIYTITTNSLEVDPTDPRDLVSAVGKSDQRAGWEHTVEFSAYKNNSTTGIQKFKDFLSRLWPGRS